MFDPVPWPPSFQPRSARERLRFCLLTWGTRGDVQPFVALGSELARRGHAVTVAAREPFRGFIEAHGLRCFALAEDGTDDLMRALADNPGGLAGVKLFLGWQRGLLGPQFEQFWAATEDADAVISNAAYTLPALHVAEARRLPIVSAFFDPGFLATRAYGLSGDRIADRGPLLNLASTRARNLALGLLTRDLVHGWRRTHGLPGLGLGELHAPAVIRRLPVLAAWSPALLPRPADWPAWWVQTGRWRLPAQEHVAARLREFVDAGDPPLYIGFGSWGVHDRTAVTDLLLRALAGRRAIIHRNTVDDRDQFPDHVYVDDDLPHDWLFPRVRAVVHHGGAGTTGAVAEAGVPSVIVPAFFGQVPWGDLVTRRGVGVMLQRNELAERSLADALRVVDDPVVRRRAAALGETARRDGGVSLAADATLRALYPSDRSSAADACAR